MKFIIVILFRKFTLFYLEKKKKIFYFLYSFRDGAATDKYMTAESRQS